MTNTSVPKGFFDIQSGHNVYEPCPKCFATMGMGLTSRPGRLFVHCDCGHAGPDVDAPTSEQYATWSVPWHERDRLAFEAWNKASRDERS